MRADALVGKTLASRYRVEARLGEGAMGTVFRAEHVKVGRKFAIKVLHPRMLENKKFRRRFEREAELAGKLRHKNVVGVVDVGVTPDGHHFIVMEYADGPTLAHLIGMPMPPDRVIAIATELCEGLQHAHEHGLIHRDFKPENIIIERDQYGGETARILDFGIAITLDEIVQADERERLTTAGLVLGTPHYMAPEHATGQAIDHRIDLFALGVICYELLTGRLPFDGDGVDVARANLTIPTPPMGVRVPNLQVDPLLEAFTRALMVKSRDARLPSARAAGELLELIATDREAAARVLGIELPEATTTPATFPTGSVELDLQPLLSSGIVWSEPVPAIIDDTEPVPPMQFDVTALAMAAIPTPVPAADTAVVRDTARRPRISTWPIALGAVVVIAAALVVVMTRSSNVEATPPVALTPVIDEPVATLPRRPIENVGPPTALALPAPTTVEAPRPAAPKKLPAPTAITAPAPKTLATLETPNAAEPSNAALADLYTAVGRNLKRLDAQAGEDATADLWPRFRFIRINEAFASRQKKIEASDALHALQRDIGSRLR
jgi:serine/threonine protein kinase